MNKKRYKIGVIGLKGLPAQGGGATVGENIIKNLNDRYSFVVYAISTHTNGIYKEKGIRQIIFRKFPVKKLNTLYYYFISVLHSLFIAKYDLIHIHHTDSGFFIPFLKLKYKVIGTTHGRGQYNDKWGRGAKLFLKYSEKIFLKYVDKVVSVSKVDAGTYERLTGKNIIHIPNGINEIGDNRYCCTRDELAKIVFAAGRIIPLKGCDLILDSFRKGNINNQLTIIGDLTHKPTYSRHLKELAKGLNVKFLGLIKNKNELFNEINKASLFIFPSRMEAMSMMLLEAASLGVPIICSDIDANKVIFSDEDVTFFKSDSSMHLLSKILWVRDNYDKAQKKAERAKNKLIKNYTWADIATSYSDLYQEVICLRDFKMFGE